MRLDHLLSKENYLKGFTVYFSMYTFKLSLVVDFKGIRPLKVLMVENKRKRLNPGQLREKVSIVV